MPKTKKEKFLQKIDECIRCKKGGKVKSPKEINRALRKFGDKMEHGFAVMSENINPMNHLLKNKTTSDLLVKSGEITNDYLLPAVTTASKGLASGAASMFGGPLAGMAVDKVTDFALSHGNNPEDNQKSQLLGSVSGIVGNLAGESLGGKIGGKVAVEIINKRIRRIKNIKQCK